MNVEQHQVAADPQTKSTNCHWAAVIYTHHYHLLLLSSGLILILPYHGG